MWAEGSVTIRVRVDKRTARIRVSSLAGKEAEDGGWGE
jgi:hypothetical protein